VHPVSAQLRTGRSQLERAGRRSLAIPQLERVAGVTDALSQTHVRRLTQSTLHYTVFHRNRLTHLVRLANTLLDDEERARDNHVLPRNFAKYSPI